MPINAEKRPSTDIYQVQPAQSESIDGRPSTKRIRMTSKSGSSTITGNTTIASSSGTTASNSEYSTFAYKSQLNAANDSNEVLQVLIQISDRLPQKEDDSIELMHTLSLHFKKEIQSAVRVKILGLLSEIMTNGSSVEGSVLVNEIILLIKYETSRKVISQGLQSLFKIGNHQILSMSVLTQILDTAKLRIISYSHNIQRHALLLFGSFAPVVSDEENEFLDLVSKYTDSQDSRVRAQAFDSILKLGSRGLVLKPNLYQRALRSLQDDYECVRKEALQLIYVLANKYPDHMITIPESDTEFRLIDAAFVNICSAICDLSMGIRKQAAELLGGMARVGNEFLHQTLDKKLMSNLKRKKSMHQRHTELFQSGEWATGKKWADDAPKEHVDEETVSLMASGACGALVHGLEDEFLEVRTAAVHSMCRLALKNPPFAITSLDFLVDMFNDEIENVRLKAIASLTAISEHIILREDQLEIILGSLEDYSVEVREGLHIMLGACTVSTQACLLMVVQKVLDVLSKYPQDKYSAFGCFQRVGKKHSELCMSLLPQLLHNHPFFDSSELDVEDPAYVCILIMIFNASPLMPPMLSLLPETTIKHYAYLRDTMPQFVPHIPIGGIIKQPMTKLPQNYGSKTSSLQFLETLLNNIKFAYAAPRARQALLHAAQDNLDRLGTIDPELSGTANFTATFLGAQLLIEQLQSGLVTPHSRTPSKECLTQLMKKCLKLQNLFSGYTINDLLMVKQICLRAFSAHLVLVVKDRSQSALGPCQILLHIAGDTNKFLQENHNIFPDAFSVSILMQIANISDPKPGRVFREILPIVQTAPPVVTPEINVKIKMCTARILDPSPTASIESIIKVTAGVIAALPFLAEIDNLQESQRQDLRLKIKYPDQMVHFLVPRMRDLKRIVLDNGKEAENNWRLRTTVLLSHGVWTEAAQVDISICLSVRPGHELELCKPIKVLFAPKPVKRGI